MPVAYLDVPAGLGAESLLHEYDAEPTRADGVLAAPLAFANPMVLAGMEAAMQPHGGSR